LNICLWEVDPMLHAFTRNYDDDSTEAGFQFTFYCDLCGDGFKSSFIESTTYGQTQRTRGLGRGASVIGSLFGGKIGDLGYALERGSDLLEDRFDQYSPQWRKEHEAAFIKAQEEVKNHFRKCQACQKWVCIDDYNEEEGLCVECAPRESAYVAQAKAKAMKRNIDDAAEDATVWTGKIESRTTVCPSCGKPAGNGKFCNQCGAPLGLQKCPNCGAEVALGMKFCSNCGSPMQAKTICPGCGAENEPGTKFCGQCGAKL
jgi:hypothetical protein